MVGRAWVQVPAITINNKQTADLSWVLNPDLVPQKSGGGASWRTNPGVAVQQGRLPS